MTATEIASKIEALSQDEATATNEGTHSLDPQWNTWTEYERLDGTRYVIGKQSDAGRTRQLRFTAAASRRAQIKSLQSDLDTLALPMDHNSQMARGYAK